ncbi:MAG: O-antigen ligase family protein [Magnetovibrionaceae bacterium]
MLSRITLPRLRLSDVFVPVSELANGRLGQAILAVIATLVLGVALAKVGHPVVLVALGLAPVAIVMALVKPFWMVLAFVVFSFFRLHEVFPQLYPLRIPQLLALGTLASLVWNLASGKLKVYWSRELTAFGVFFIITTVGVFLATNRGDALGSWSGTYVKIAIMVLAIVWLSCSLKAFHLTSRVMIGSGLLVAAVTLQNKALGIGLVEGTRVTIGRDIGSMLGDPNDLSLVLLFPASFALALMLTKGIGRWSRLLGLLAFIAFVAAIVATQSRGGLLGITAVMGVYAWRRVKNKALLISVGLAALSVLFVLAGVSDRASGGAHEEGIDESAMGRIHAWGAAFNMALAHPLTGVGLNNFLSNYWSYSSFWDGKNHAVHSTWFGVMAETGFLGLGCFLTMIGLTIRSACQSVFLLQPDQSGEGAYEPEAYALAQAVQSGLAGFMVSGTFLTMGFTWPVYIQLALTVAVTRYALSEREKRLRFANQIADQSHSSH